MMTLKELKEEFTKRTNLPAKKSFVIAICGATTMTMRSKSDWVWALENIKQEFRTEEAQESYQELQEYTNSLQANLDTLQLQVISLNETLEEVQSNVNILEVQCVNLQSDLQTSEIKNHNLEIEITKLKSESKADVEVNDISDLAYYLSVDDAERFFHYLFYSSNTSGKDTYRNLSKKYHPDVNQNKVNATELTTVLNKVYEDISDEDYEFSSVIQGTSNFNYEKYHRERKTNDVADFDDWDDLSNLADFEDCVEFIDFIEVIETRRESKSTQEKSTKSTDILENGHS